MNNKNLTKAFNQQPHTNHNFNNHHLTNFDQSPSTPSTPSYSTSNTSTHKRKHTSTNSYSYTFDCYTLLSHKYVLNTSTDSSNGIHNKIPWDNVEFMLRKTGSPVDSCTVCKEENQTIPVASQCGHIICASCVYRQMDSLSKNAVNCPVCNSTIVKRDLRFVVFQDATEDEDGSVELVLMSKLRNSNVIGYNHMERELSLFDAQVNQQRQQDLSEDEQQYLFWMVHKQFQYATRYFDSCGEPETNDILTRVVNWFTDRYGKLNRNIVGDKINQLYIADQENQKDNFNLCDQYQSKFSIPYNQNYIRTLRDIELNYDEQTYFYQDIQGRKTFLHPIWFCILRDSQFDANTERKYLPSQLYAQEMSSETLDYAYNTYQRYRYLNHLDYGDRIKFVDIDQDCLEDILIEPDVYNRQQYKLPSIDKIEPAHMDDEQEGEEQDENWEIYKKAFLTEKVDLSQMLINDQGISNNFGFGVVQGENVVESNDVNLNNQIGNENDERERKKSKEWGKSVTEATLLKRFQGNVTLDHVQNDLHNIYTINQNQCISNYNNEELKSKYSLNEINEMKESDVLQKTKTDVENKINSKISEDNSVSEPSQNQKKGKEKKKKKSRDVKDLNDFLSFM